MIKGGKLALLGAMAACALGAAQADAATTIDISAASSTGTTLFLDAGDYSFNFIGTAQGGAYDAWRAWNTETGCNAQGANCSQGWLVTLFLDLGNGLDNFDHTNGFAYYQSMLPDDTRYYATAELANAQAQSAAYKTIPLTNPGPWTSYPESTDPFKLSLSTGQNVNFFIRDTNYTDNSAGVSIALKSVAAVPEPATWAMLLVGFGAVGAAMRRRRVTTCVAFG